MKKILIGVMVASLLFLGGGYGADAAAQKNAPMKKGEVKKSVSAKKSVKPAKKAVVPAKKNTVKQAQKVQKKQIAPGQLKKALKPTTMTVVKTISANASNLLVPKAYHITNPTSATFSIGETLRGQPFTATGTTNEVSGIVTLDRNMPSKTTLGPIKINAKTFKTDSSGRDFMIKKFILKAEDEGNEFVVFSPKTITGLPTSFENGKTLALEMSGDLTIAGITHPAMFSGTATVNADSVQGTAQAKIKRADYGIVVPSVPFVASVDEEVTLTISLTAK